MFGSRVVHMVLSQFDLDEALYAQLLMQSRRHQYEATDGGSIEPPRRTTLLSRLHRDGKRTPMTAVYFVCWVCAVVDGVSALLLYLKATELFDMDINHNRDLYDYSMLLLRWQVMLRASIFALTETYVAWLVRTDEPKSTRRLVGLALLPLLLVGIVAFVYAVVVASCNYHFGHTDVALANPQVRSCLMEQDVWVNQTLYGFNESACKALQSSELFTKGIEYYDLQMRSSETQSKLFNQMLCKAFAPTVQCPNVFFDDTWF